MPSLSRNARRQRAKRAIRRADSAAPATPPLTGKYLLMWFWDPIPIGIGILLLMVSWLWVSKDLGVLNLATDAESWPTTPGVVTASWMEEEWRRGRGYMYGIHVTYTYSVEGTTYTGDDVRSGGYWINDRSDAEAKVAEYPVGATIDVRYDPGDPGRSLLETRISGPWLYLFRVGMGVAFGVGGVVMLARSFRNVWRRMGQPG